jgi:aspartate aminotransferase-like enzyme
MADLTHAHGGIFLMDTVTGLGGNEVKVRGISGVFLMYRLMIGV